MSMDVLQFHWDFQFKVIHIGYANYMSIETAFSPSGIIEKTLSKVKNKQQSMDRFSPMYLITESFVCIHENYI